MSDGGFLHGMAGSNSKIAQEGRNQIAEHSVVDVLLGQEYSGQNQCKKMQRVCKAQSLEVLGERLKLELFGQGFKRCLMYLWTQMYA